MLYILIDAYFLGVAAGAGAEKKGDRVKEPLRMEMARGTDATNILMSFITMVGPVSNARIQ